MGGRGAGSGMGKTVPYDRWGKMIENEYVYDGDGNVIGNINDELHFVYEPEIRKTTKQEVLNEIDSYRNDDGTYGDEDVHAYLAYKDGTFVDLEDLQGKKYKKAGIVGASITTPDSESVWGGEIGKDGKISEWKTDGGNGSANTYAGYKATGSYISRVKTTYNNLDANGLYKTKRETIKQSTVKPIGKRL